MGKGNLICNILKEVRRRTAEANGIEYTPSTCNHRGDCMGTCPTCEAEVQYLEHELEKKKQEKEEVNIVRVAEIDKDKLLESEREMLKEAERHRLAEEKSVGKPERLMGKECESPKKRN